MAEMKTEQLQIRVSVLEKKAIRKRAAAAGLGLSEWVLSCVLPSSSSALQGPLRALAKVQDKAERSYAFAEIHDLFKSWSKEQLAEALRDAPLVELNDFCLNYLAAMAEQACRQKHVEVPSWILEVESLKTPYFASSLQSLRIYLLTNTPVAFRRRNLFVDTSVGDRV